MEEIYTLKADHPHTYAIVYESKTTYKKVFPDFRFESDRKSLNKMCEMVEDLERKIPHLVPKTISVDKTARDLTIIMEKVEGITMGEFTKKKRGLLETYKVIVSLIDAVLSFHKAGYFHGDLHGGNIIVKEDLSVVLIDFDMIEKFDLSRVEEMGDHSFLKFHISSLVYQFDEKYLSVGELLEKADTKKAKDVMGYDTDPLVARSVFGILKKL